MSILDRLNHLFHHLAFLPECRKPFNRLILVFSVLAGKFTNLPIIPNHQPFSTASLFSVPFKKNGAKNDYWSPWCSLCCQRISAAFLLCSLLLHVFLPTFYPFRVLYPLFGKTSSFMSLIISMRMLGFITVACSHNSFNDGLVTNLRIKSFAR